MANPKIQLRHDTAANWASVNPILLEGEVGLETDTLKQKVGDGTTAWSDLPYSINYDSFDLPIQKYVAQTGTTWDENKLVYNPTSKVFTPTDTVTGGEYANLHPTTFNIPSNINLDSYNDSWALIIPNGVFTVNSTNVSNLICYEIYAEDGNMISRLWYGASDWRKGNSASTIGSVDGREWNIQHLSGETITCIKGLYAGFNDLSQDCTFVSTAGRINKVVIFVNSQMNMNVPVGNITLNKIDSSGNILEEYPLFTESTQPQIKLSYNPDNLTVNSNNQLDTTTNLSEINNKVDKSGDTMTGKLNFTTDSISDMRQVTTFENVTAGTTPSTNIFAGFQTLDRQGNQFANVNCSYKTDGVIGSNLWVTRPELGSEYDKNLGIYITPTGSSYAQTNTNFYVSKEHPILHAKDTSLIKGTPPSSRNYTKALNIIDNNNISFGGIEHGYLPSGANEITMKAYRGTDTTMSPSTRITVGFNDSNEAYTYAPACNLNNSIVTTVSHTYSSNNNTINAVKFGNGLIINWGRVSLNGVISSTNKTITFAIPYTTNAKVVASRNSNAGQATPVVVGWEGTTSFNIGCPSGSSSTGYVNFIAIGY